MLIPFLRAPCYVDGSTVRYHSTTAEDLPAPERAVLQATFSGGYDLKGLAQVFVDAGGAGDIEAAQARLFERFSDPKNLIGVTEVSVDPSYDIILVEQGYGGVYVHTVELLKKLRERWKCLLLSPSKVMFDTDPLPEVITLEDLKQDHASLNYFAWFQLVRTIVKLTGCKVLLLGHRSQSLFLFDLLADRKTVIYCDGFFDGAFRRVQDFRFDKIPNAESRILSEIYYLIANGHPEFLAVSGSPATNPLLLMAGGFSLRSAVENWCWGARQHTEFASAFPELGESVRLMLPFTNSALFREDIVEREPLVLFTTTMHNIEKKGFPELIKAMSRVREVHVRCVVRQPHLLPKFPERLRERMEIGPVDKPEMIELYHRVWVNCRTSREESSPLSILESMSCEVPQITSPTVAEQIPIIADGVTGFVVDPDDIDRLAWALRTILADRGLRDRMGRECRRRALQLSFENREHEFERLLS